jgi:hypothetical protein
MSSPPGRQTLAPTDPDRTVEPPMTVQTAEPPASRSALAWGRFALAAPALAVFGAARLATPAWAYLATMRPDDTPRVHPVTPILTPGRLFVFMEPNSPKGHDLRIHPWYALHNAVADMNGSGGEFAISGAAVLVDSPTVRAEAAEAAPYEPADRYILFELLVAEVRCKGYGDVDLPEPRRWNLAATRSVRSAGPAVRMETR